MPRVAGVRVGKPELRRPCSWPAPVRVLDEIRQSAARQGVSVSFWLAAAAEQAIAAEKEKQEQESVA